MAALYQYTRPLPFQPLPTYRDSNANVAIKLDLNALYIKRPKETFFIKVNNPNLLTWGIDLGDLLIVEKEQVQFFINDLIVVEQNRQYKFYQFFAETQNRLGQMEKVLLALDTKDHNLTLQSWSDVKVIGVITNIVHPMRNVPSARQYQAPIATCTQYAA